MIIVLRNSRPEILDDAFHIELIPKRKAWIYLFSLIWVNIKADRVF